ncbi:hypothetical protein B0H10DRAFT_1940498 [Mycena sp. CBHHK59/15]|nr:hypothetical protein B0H10DRAFT_1940498 [Mycena sp. CBHHK59/15]
MSPPPSPTKGPISPEERVDWQRRQNTAPGALLAQEEFHLSQEAGVSETLGLNEEGLQLAWNAGWTRHLAPSKHPEGGRSDTQRPRSALAHRPCHGERGEEADSIWAPVEYPSPTREDDIPNGDDMTPLLMQEDCTLVREGDHVHSWGCKVTTYFLPHEFPDDPKWRGCASSRKTTRRVERSGEEGDGSVMVHATAVFKATPGAELKASCDKEELWKFLEADMA